ncbi:MAG: hypothetical protein Q9221_003659 [Calogaya cf. arnoldii]
MFVSIEWGSFDSELSVLPNTEYDIEVNQLSRNPGDQMFQKRISGMFLGEVFRTILAKLQDECSPGSSEEDDSKKGNLTSHQPCLVDVGVDGSVIEFYPPFEVYIREALRAVSGIATAVERLIRMGLAKDGSTVGAAIIALVAAQQIVDHYPAEDEKLRASSIIRRRGGNCPNSLEILQQLLDTDATGPTISLALLAVLPSSSSPAYQELRSSFRVSTDLTNCICREQVNEPASSYIVRSRQVDSRTIINYNGLPEMTTEEFATVADKLRDNMGWCHFEGRIPDVTLRCMQHLRQFFPNVKISVEVEKPGREGLQNLAAPADVDFYSKSWAQANSYTSSEESSLLLCTWGDAGVGALELPSQRYEECPAFKTEGINAVDTVGAGDTFIAGMLFGLTCRGEWDLDRKLEFANELAGRKVVQEGLRGLGSLMQHAL